MFSASSDSNNTFVDDEDNTLLHYFAAMNDIDEVKKMNTSKNPKIAINADEENRNKETPLHIAVRHNAIDVVRYLVDECKADANHLSTDNESPLMLAIAFGHLTCLQIMAAKIKEFGKYTFDGHPILCFAAHHGHLAIVLYLLVEHKVDVNALTPSGKNALYTAIISDLNSATKPALIPLLVKRGVQISPEILQLAAKVNSHLYTYLHAEFSRQCHLAICSNKPEEFEKLGGKAIAEIKDVDDRTPLEIAIAYGKFTMTIYLVNTCLVDLNVKNKAGQTPYQQADALGYELIKKYLLRVLEKRAAKISEPKKTSAAEEKKPSKAKLRKQRQADLKKLKNQTKVANQQKSKPNSNPALLNPKQIANEKDETLQLTRLLPDGLANIFKQLAERKTITPSQQTATHTSTAITQPGTKQKATVLSFANIINKHKPVKPIIPAVIASPIMSVATTNIVVDPTPTIPSPILATVDQPSQTPTTTITADDKPIQTQKVALESVTEPPTPTLKIVAEPIQSPKMTPTSTPTTNDIDHTVPQTILSMLTETKAVPISAGSISPLVLPEPAYHHAIDEKKSLPQPLKPPGNLYQFLDTKTARLPEDTIAWMSWLQRLCESALRSGAIRDYFKTTPCTPNDLDFYLHETGKNLINHALQSGMGKEAFHACEYMQYLYQNKSSLLPLDVNCLGTRINFLMQLYHLSKRADFSVNSIAIWLKDPYSYHAPNTPVDIVCFDTNKGFEHLAKNILQLCGPKEFEETRFVDDPTLIFRFLRTAFAIRKLDGSMPDNYSHYLALSQRYASALHQTTSMSKICDEFSKCILRGSGAMQMKMMVEGKILAPLFFPAEDKDRQLLEITSQGYDYLINEMNTIDAVINEPDFTKMFIAKREMQLSIYRSQIYGMIIGLHYAELTRKVGGIKSTDFTNKINELLVHFNVLMPKKLDGRTMMLSINKTISKCLATVDQQPVRASSCHATRFNLPQTSAADAKPKPASPPSPP